MKARIEGSVIRGYSVIVERGNNFRKVATLENLWDAIALRERIIKH
jgi:hypothetical protein